MSIDLSLIIPNQCRSLHDKAEAGKCFNDTIERITNYFHGHKQLITNCCTIAEPDEYNCIEYSFEIPLLNITANMFAGFWDIWPVASYSQYFYPYGKDLLGNPQIWPRDVCFDTLLAFGQHEGWICDEYHAWNSSIDFETGSFESWKAYGKSPDDSRIYEFNIMDFAEVNPETGKYANYQHKYHDKYKEHHDVLTFLRKRFPQYDILTLHFPLHQHLLAAKDSQLFLLNYETGKCFTDFPIDNLRADFNGAGIQIFRGKESAFFNTAGQQLTAFRIGDFSWNWDARKCNFFGQIITDHANGKRFLTDGTPFEE